MTNADKIRAMTNEELATWLYKQISYRCRACDQYKHCLEYGWAATDQGWLDWLEVEADAIYRV